MQRKSLAAVVVTAAFAMALVTVQVPHASAQTLYGSIVGSVTDPSGAAVEGAGATATSPITGLSRKTTTDQSGYYSFPTLPAGSYEITLSHPGFSEFVRKDVPVSINSVVRIDVPLTMGAVTERVAVTATNPLLQTDRADVHTDLESRQLQDLPTPPGRNFEQLLGTVSGFTPPGQNNSIAANPARGLSFNANGASRNGTNIRIDGASMNQVWLNHLTAYIPALEAIDTVNIVTNSFDAEQGLAGGAAVNVIIKSGTNNLHGSAFEFNNNNQTKAKPFFLPAGQGKPKYILNDFGGTLGGRIIRNKLFYFGSYEGALDRETGATFTTVPNAAIRAGNMSGSSSPIYDPLTGSSDGSGRQMMPGNQVPVSRQSAIVQKLVALTPLPNLPGLTNNYYAVGSYKFDRHIVDAKINYNPTSKLSVYGRFGMLHYKMLNPPVFGQLGGPMVQTAAGFAGTAMGETYTGSVGATYLAKPNFIIDGNFGFTLLKTHSIPIRLDENLGSDFLGIPGTNNGSQLIAGGWPSFQVSTYTTLGLPFTNWPVNYYDPSFKYSVNFNWTKGSHNVRFGAEVSRQHLNHTEYIMPGASGGGPGTFSFSGGVTTIKGGASPNQYNSYADFLLGLPSGISKMQHPDWISSRNWQNGLYIRDQWQATRRLTLSYGVRWEYYPMPTRPDRGVENYDPKTDKMLICGVGNIPGDCGISVSKLLFSPRIGVAYRITDTFVMRAGYGINYDPFPLAKTTLDNYPVMLALSLSGANSFVPAGTLAQGIPPLVSPDISTGRIAIPSNFVANTLPANFIRGYLQSWNFTLQKQIGNNFTAQVGYVATRQVHQLGTINLNVGIPGGGVPSQPFYQLYGRSAAVTITGPVGGSHYDSMQARLTHRFSHGLQLQANYTFSKAIGICCNPDSESSPAIQLPQYYNLNRSVEAFDRTHAFVLTSTYELPFGKGKKFVNQGGIVSALAGGWQLTGILPMYSGLPFSVSAAGTSLNAPGNTQRANQVKANVEKLGGIGATQAYYDPLAFAPVTTATFGTAGFNSLRGPGYISADVGVFRNFVVREHWKLEFRAEAFNATNTPHFGNPSANVSNLQLNPDGSVRNLGGFMTITTLSPIAASREGIDERLFRFGLHLRF